MCGSNLQLLAQSHLHHICQFGESLLEDLMLHTTKHQVASSHRLNWSLRHTACYDARRRRSVDNRDNGAPKQSTWHGVENTEAALEIMNDL